MSRRILLVDCARREPLVALVGDEGLLAAARPPKATDDPRGRLLFGCLEELLAGAGWTWPTLDLLACGTGPGPMSGTRVGIATVLGLCRALDRPAAGLPAWFAWADPGQAGWQDVRFRLDRGLVAGARVRVDPAGWQLDDPQLLADTAGDFPDGTGPEALVAATLAATPGPAGALQPVYLREPDVRPQADALGRPLPGGPA